MQIEIMSGSMTAAISTHGAELQSLKDVFGKEYIWYADKKYWGRHSPILFPIIGEQRGSEYVYNGKTYKITRHGFVRDSDFEVLNKSKNSCTLTFSANEKTREMYPFEFTFRVEYRIDETSLHVKYSVLNMGESEMYFCLGGHTGFNCPLSDDESFNDYFISYPQKETYSRLLLNEEGHFNGKTEKFIENSDRFDLNHQIFDKDAIVPDNLKSKSVSLINKKSGHGVKMDFPDFETLAVWSEKGNSPFVCLEPWSGRASSEDEDKNLTSKHGIIKLDAGKCYNALHKITLL